MDDDEIEIIPIDLSGPSVDAPAEEPPSPDGESEASARRRPWQLVLAAAVGAVVVGVAVWALVLDDDSPDDDAAAATSTTTSTTRLPAISADVYAAALPSVVVIQTEGVGEDGGVVGGVGAGVIVSGEGAILTAHHVVADATSIRVVFADGTTGEAEVVVAEPDDDIAVLTTDARPVVIVPAVLGGTGRLRVGDEAYAVGNPLGLTMSLSAGVISGFERSLPIDENRTLDGLIQFDTAVNPGNSGGPLLDREGRVIGIVTALANPSDGQDFSGIGFAVTIETAGGTARVPGQ